MPPSVTPPNSENNLEPSKLAYERRKSPIESMDIRKFMISSHYMKSTLPNSEK